MVTIEKGKNQEISSIQLSKVLIAKLASLGKKKDTYEVIIWRLLNGSNPAEKEDADETGRVPGHRGRYNIQLRLFVLSITI